MSSPTRGLVLSETFVDIRIHPQMFEITCHSGRVYMVQLNDGKWEVKRTSDFERVGPLIISRDSGRALLLALSIVNDIERSKS